MHKNKRSWNSLSAAGYYNNALNENICKIKQIYIVFVKGIIRNETLVLQPERLQISRPLLA